MKMFVKTLLVITMFIYLLVLTKLVLLKHYAISEVFNFHFDMFQIKMSNFIPFKTIITYMFLTKDLSLNIRIENLVGNIIGFTPLGLLLPLISKKMFRLKVITLTTFLLSFTYEVIQLFTYLGTFDIDDLILNTLGGVLGYLLIKLIYVTLFVRKKSNKYNEATY
ncbi:VanZ family protein [Bacillus sp. BGMRC 2118]|nr:VanZ family protein [Bacillus sp. BGMRC 2118]